MRHRLRTLLAQFSVRDLLWLVVLAAVVSSWMRDRRHIATKFAAERAADAVRLQQQLDFSANEAQKFVTESQRLRAQLLLIEKRERNSDDDPTPSLPIPK